MQALPLRLQPGDDLRGALEQHVREQPGGAGFIVSGIGSLRSAELRFADESEGTRIAGPLEIISIGGSLTPDGAHLHMSVADRHGRVWGGHVMPGNVVRTTVEALIMLVPNWSLSREHDLRTGFKELVVRPRQP